jgi:hypothetical protein
MATTVRSDGQAPLFLAILAEIRSISGRGKATSATRSGMPWPHELEAIASVPAGVFPFPALGT